MNRYIPLVLCLNTVIFLFIEQSMAQSNDGILDNSSEGSFTLTLKVIKSSLNGFINSGGNSNTRAERAQVVLSSGPPGLSRPRNSSSNGLGNLNANTVSENTETNDDVNDKNSGNENDLLTNAEDQQTILEEKPLDLELRICIQSQDEGTVEVSVSSGAQDQSQLYTNNGESIPFTVSLGDNNKKTKKIVSRNGECNESNEVGIKINIPARLNLKQQDINRGRINLLLKPE
jgi:hypothetical protein